MVDLVERMLDMHRQLPTAQTPHEQKSLKRQIAATDKQIEALVYVFYGLSDAGIATVEGRNR